VPVSGETDVPKRLGVRQLVHRLAKRGLIDVRTNSRVAIDPVKRDEGRVIPCFEVIFESRVGANSDIVILDAKFLGVPFDAKRESFWQNDIVIHIFFPSFLSELKSEFCFYINDYPTEKIASAFLGFGEVSMMDEMILRLFIF
jgi:hypothetical protein